MAFLIYLVEDDPDILLVLQSTIRYVGFEARGFFNGRTALEAFRDAPPELGCVVTDLNLPDVHGIELIEQARRIHPNLPIGIITAFGTTEIVAKCASLGANFFLPKPFQSSEFLALIRVAQQSSCSESLTQDTTLRNQFDQAQLDLGQYLLQPLPWVGQKVSTNRGRATNPQTVPTSIAEESVSPTLKPLCHTTEVSATPQDRSLSTLYPFIMGGLLHNALNSITSILFRLDDPATQRLNAYLHVMQNITQSFYATGDRQSVHAQLSEVTTSFVEDNPAITYHFSIDKALAELPLPAGVSTVIMGELLKNATKACSTRQRADIWLVIEVFTDDEMVSFECKDTGVGFSDEMLTKIDAHELQPPIGNTVGGYGLYLLQELAGRLEGALLASNNEAGGARIQALLPFVLRKS